MNLTGLPFLDQCFLTLFCFYTVQPALGHQQVCHTSRKCLGSCFPWTSCLGPWVPPVTPFPLLAPLSCWPLAQDACPAQPHRAICVFLWLPTCFSHLHYLLSACIVSTPCWVVCVLTRLTPVSVEPTVLSLLLPEFCLLADHVRLFLFQGWTHCAHHRTRLPLLLGVLPSWWLEVFLVSL